MISIPELNQLPPAEFARALRPLFESAPPLAAALYAARPFPSYAALIDRAEGLLAAMPRAHQIEVVNAHPRIGENAQVVSEQSYREQGYAAEAGQDLKRVYARLAELNAEYEQRFGFRFVVFVKGRPKADIVELLEQRLHGSPEAELRLALSEMLAIARDRLSKLH